MAAISITAANVASASLTATGVAGTTVTAGQALYLSSSDTRLYLADANDTDATAVFVGIATHGSLAGQPLTYARPTGTIVIGATLVVGSVYVLGTTPGAINPAGDIATSSRTVIIGYATSATVLYILGTNTATVYAGAGGFAA